MPPGAVIALGAIAPALLLIAPKDPARFPGAGSFRVPVAKKVGKFPT